MHNLTRPVIHVYKTLDQNFRAYIKGDPSKEAFGSAPELAIRTLVSKYNINDFRVHSADRVAVGMR